MRWDGLRTSVRMLISDSSSTQRKIRQSIAAVALLGLVDVAAAQQQPLSPGEAVATRFSGTASVPGPNNAPFTVIDPGAPVASIIDLRTPGRPPQGQQWFDKPQRNVAFAAQVGQVFGVAIDNANPPSIYLSATSAFGLHRMPGNTQWMPGMWGVGGGPGTVYILDARAGYQPRPFAEIRLNARPNTGAGLGNIAFDRWNRQLFVSDLETGMILQHPRRGRSRPRLLRSRCAGPQQLPGRSIRPAAFRAADPVRLLEHRRPSPTCPLGEFRIYARVLEHSRIRPPRLGPRRLAPRTRQGSPRLYYSVWSSPEFDSAGWQALFERGKTQFSVVRAASAPGGGFRLARACVGNSSFRIFRRPTRTLHAPDISRPVSDIAFPRFRRHAGDAARRTRRHAQSRAASGQSFRNAA